MAKRSDFAQKLLDDLRMRKERMAATQSSKGSKSMAGDAYAYTKQTHRGSREMKANQMNSLRNGSTHNRPRGGNKSLYIAEASKDIVPFGRGHSTEQIGDLSMALAFALGNGGKLTRMDSSGNTSMFGFLNQLGRRSVDLSRMERSSFDGHITSTSRFPTLSHLHIKEIAKGAQKLNQILTACSNGLNFDRYSIDIGKELMKGAMDLEESLRMLVNLQEASEYMISPQRKSRSRITLLDEEEDDNDNTINTAEHKQLGIPTFSFDKPSRNSNYIQKVARTDLKQRQMALTYPSEATNCNNNKHTLSTSKSDSHKRSTSYGSNEKTLATYKGKNHFTTSSKLEPQNGRIPNVIAKLMGLEEIPGSEDSKYATQKESSSKQNTDRMASKKTAAGSTMHDRKKRDAENVVPQIKKQEKIHPNQTRVIQSTPVSLQAEKNFASPHAKYEGDIHEPPRKDVERNKQMRGINKAKTNIEKSQNNISQLNQSPGRQKEFQEKERKQEITKPREQKSREKGETKELTPKHELQKLAPQAQKALDVGIILQRQAESTSSMLKVEKKEANKMSFSNQSKSPNDLGLQKPHQFYNSEPHDGSKHHPAETEEQRVIIPVIRKRGGEAMPKSLPRHIHDAANVQRKNYTNQATYGNKNSTESPKAMQFNGFPNHMQHEGLLQYRNPKNDNINVQDPTNRHSSQISSVNDMKSDFTKEKRTTSLVRKPKSVHLSSMQKVKNTKIQKVESPRKVDEVMVRSGVPHNLTKSMKHPISILQEGNQRRSEKLGASKEAKQERVSRCKEAEAETAGIQQSGVSEELEIIAEQASNPYSHHVFGGYKSLKGPEIQDLNSQNMTSTVTNNQQGQDFGSDEPRSGHTVLDQLNGTHQSHLHSTYSSQLEKQQVPTLEAPEPLTESENLLKQIVIKSQLFLNTSEALFKLNIPYDILDASGHYSHNEESKLLLDCGYEVTKRKGKRQELLSIHPFMSEFMTSLKITSLDELIKQLNKDIKTLKFYGRNDNAECNVEEYLPEMLEIDVYDRVPDVNCMWDLGWDKMMFSVVEKEEVIRDVEKHVLNGLLDELTRDLLLVY